MRTVTDSLGPRAAGVRVWDPAVRLFHWSLAGAIAWETLAEAGTDSHEVVGYLVLVLVTFRIAWGFVGPRHARFADFVVRPARVLAYLKDILGGHPRRYLGHNPAGGAMVLALLAAAAATGLSGWAMTTDALWGVEWIEELHETLANGTLLLVALHVGGVMLAGFQHRENLVRSMVTGRKSPR
ncbi:cytochrome b/b6 domain-containing protein [Cereibacter sphaeroides]|uniref:cytochrome b/b6 domain-containing protein n=1 Tax=Cereibacter sphaeroides TaxID=1063 RepID=UPI00313D775E